MKKHISITAILLILLINCGFGQLPPGEFITNSTIKILTQYNKIKDGKLTSYTGSGTGFFFNFDYGDSTIPVIVTNFHVIDSIESVTFYFKQKGQSGEPLYTKTEKIKIDKSQLKWIKHPDPKVDLAIMPITPLLNHYQKLNKGLFYAAYEENDIPNDSTINSLSAMENVLMLGYPSGLRDIKNDLPIVRQGITATPYYIDYNSNQEFLCDLSMFPGSSGSPIVIFNPGSFIGKYGEFYLRSRFIFLGIAYKTYTRGFEAKITNSDSSNLVINNPTITTSIPLNVAVVIKAIRLLDFKPLLK
ncbi:serine protease [Daejeonella sp.]|uniref:S1 family peptidase n=1 Tax=Daejeonella sp. TaxID=2805397 RepID=UPI002731A907|nr:serine protease [Daejeonella sp.]MDP2413842.1 serine protease [Daejeonella sp.]